MTRRPYRRPKRTPPGQGLPIPGYDPALTMSEADLTANVVAACKTLGIMRYHTHRSDRSVPGYPDETLVGTRVLFRELKQQKKYPSPEQRKWLAALREAGQDADVWKPADWLSGRILAELQAISPRR